MARDGGWFDVFFRERGDGRWDYFPAAHRSRGYQVDAAQRARLLRLIRYKRLYLFAAAVVLLSALMLIDFGLWRFPLRRWSWQAGLGVWLAVVSPVYVANILRNRSLRKLPHPEHPMSVDEFRLRLADRWAWRQMIARTCFCVVLLVAAGTGAWWGYRSHNIGLMAAGTVLAIIPLNGIWEVWRVWRIRGNLAVFRARAPGVFD